MAEDIPFISELDLEAMLGVLIPSTDLILSISLDSACDRVRSYLGQRVNYFADDVEYHDGRDRSTIRLRERPVRAVDSVYEDDVLIESTKYVLRGAILRLPEDTFALGTNNVKVTYDHGWDVTAPLNLVVPADIRLAALQLARRIYKSVANSATAAASLQSETMGSYSYTNSVLPDEVAAVLAVAGELLDTEKKMLAPYVVRKIP